MPHHNASADISIWYPNGSYADVRITHVAAIDPGALCGGFVWGLAAVDTADMVPNVLLIGLGGPADRMSAADFDQSGLANILPNATIERIMPSFHVAAMPARTPAHPPSQNLTSEHAREQGGT